MADLSQLFTIVISSDRMTAELHYTDEYLVNRDLEITLDAFQELLKENNINFGIKHEVIDRIIEGLPLEDFPVVIAEGNAPIPGKDGEIHYIINFNPKVNKTEDWNFREVMRIPSVDKGEKLAKITLPTEGEEGTDISGEIVPPKPGKEVKVRAGKNVLYDEESYLFIADTVGQASIQGNQIHVHPIFEVTDSLSMKEGNLDFIGTIIVRGDVPSGYTLTAGGDIKIFGLVEAANIQAEGSIYVAEGLSGLQKGIINAKESIQIGYVNQGYLNAGKNIYVENSIIHSECIAGSELICQRGSIIGGRVSATEKIHVKHVGNHLSTRTELTLGQNHLEQKRLEELQAKKKEIEDTLSKLKVIGEKISKTPNIESNQKLLLTLKRQVASYDKNNELLADIDEQLQSLTLENNGKHAVLTVNGTIYENTIVSFGKYKRVIEEAYKQVELELVRNEIYMRSF